MICNLAFNEQLWHSLVLLLPHDSLDEGLRPPRCHLDYLEVEYMKRCIGEVSTALREGRKDEAHRLASTLVAQTVGRFFLTSPVGSDDVVPQWLARLVSQMRRLENFRQGYSRMCVLSPCSPNHLCRCFRQYYGQRPTDFINSEKLKYSLFLLSESRMSIIEVCQECGFANLSHFYHLFKKSFGTTPLKARKEGLARLRNTSDF